MSCSLRPLCSLQVLKGHGVLGKPDSFAAPSVILLIHLLGCPCAKADAIFGHRWPCPFVWDGALEATDQGLRGGPSRGTLATCPPRCLIPRAVLTAQASLTLVTKWPHLYVLRPFPGPSTRYSCDAAACRSQRPQEVGGSIPWASCQHLIPFHPVILILRMQEVGGACPTLCCK